MTCREDTPLAAPRLSPTQTTADTDQSQSVHDGVGEQHEPTKIQIGPLDV